MPEYRRIFQSGGTYFFTIVTYKRKSLFSSQQCRDILHSCWQEVQSRHPFTTIALCLLPDHMHTIWKLPEDDADYPMRWKEIKRLFTRRYIDQIGSDGGRNESHQVQGEAAIWQRRYWAHVVMDQEDLNNHIDYIHSNPLKHGLVNRVADWHYSTFMKYVEKGIYPTDWGGENECRLLEKFRGE